MKIKDTNVSNSIMKFVKKSLGEIYFFNHIAVIEFSEGAHIDIDASEEFFDELSSYFGTSRPFGVITNRVNSYSVKLLDIDLFKEKSKNLCSYAVVGHTIASKMNAEIENSFCLSEKTNYDSIYEALDTVYNKVRENIKVTLN
mgnify:CR=1 FL=1